jgi:hypothetical protein
MISRLRADYRPRWTNRVVTFEAYAVMSESRRSRVSCWSRWRRRSFGSHSERGERFAESVMNVVHTARKQGTNVLESLTA